MRIALRGARGLAVLAALTIVVGHVSLAAALPVSDVQPFLPASSLPLGSSDSAAVVYNDYVYQVGGASSQFGSSLEVNYAAINPNGSLGAWTETTPLPNAVYQTAAVAYNGYIYVVGGAPNGGNGSSATVYFAPLNNDGTVGTWATTGSLPQPLAGHAAVVNDDYIYVVAGTDTNAGFSNKIYYAPLGNDGTISNWAVGATLPDYSYEGMAAVLNDHIYVMGGLGNSFAPSANVYSATLNVDGSISAGQLSPNQMPAPVVDGSAVVSGDYIYVLGGGNDFNVEGDTVYFAQVNGDGSTDAWQTSSTTLPTAIKQGSAVANNGYLYSVGGYNNGSLDAVYYAAITTAATADTDGDSVLDTEENASPNAGDANDDGTPDFQQANVATLLNPVNGQYQVIETDCSSLFGIQVGGESSESPDTAYSYPMGLTQFRANCGAPGVVGTFSQTFFGTNGNDSYVFRKSGTGSSYTTLDDYQLSGVLIEGELAFRVTYSVADGGPFDDDGTENGVIIDPAGLGLPVAAGVSANQNGGVLAETGQSARLVQIIAASLFITSTIGLVILYRRGHRHP